MKRLATQGTVQNRKIYARHGAREPMFGVSYANLEKLRKEIKVDHALAAALWESGNHDARVLATKIADPEKCSADMLSKWLKSSQDRVVNGALAQLAARNKSALTLASKWIASGNEDQAVVGWTVLAILAEQGAAEGVTRWKELVDRIEKEIHRSSNWVRYAMNNALIGIGVGCAELTKVALAAAERIGQVEVDHGETGCKTPAARTYILKTLEHRKKKAVRVRVT
jgi:3-methyladenine DNA glycosylase AlkD